MKSVGLSVVLLALLWPVALKAGDAKLVRIDGGNAQMQGLPLLVDGSAVGVVGDTITVSPANRTLSVKLPWGLVLDYDLAFRGGYLSARESAREGCVGTTSWVVPNPATLSVRAGHVTSVELVKPNPVFLGVCEVSLPNLECKSRTRPVQINSIPEVGATISIDGVGLNATTSRQLNVGFCDGGATELKVALSKPGFEPCTTVVDLNAEGSLARASCSLRKLH